MTIASDSTSAMTASAHHTTVKSAKSTTSTTTCTSVPSSSPRDPLLARIVAIDAADADWRRLVCDTWAFVEDVMSRYDSSHDFSHIRRVLTLSLEILNITTTTTQQTFCRPLCARTVALGALLHDVGDRKYLLPSQDASTMVLNALVSLGCDVSLATRVQKLCSAVSYSKEVRNPTKVRDLIAGEAPELAVVQDADRLDAIGAVGIGRTFTYGGARNAQGGLDEVIEHFGEKLELLEGMMKTDAGREMARVRTERLRLFKSWWEEETGEAM